MALDGVLANIPGLAGYLATQQNDQRQALGGLQGVMQLMQAVESAQQAPLKAQLMQSQLSEAQRANQERTQMASRLAEIQARYGPRTEQVTDTLPDDEMTGTPAQQVQRTVQRPMDLAGAAGEMLFTPGLQGVGSNLLNTMEARQGRQEQAQMQQQARLQELQMRMQDSAATREQRAQAAAEANQLRADIANAQIQSRRDVAEFMVANRQPPAPRQLQLTADAQGNQLIVNPDGTVRPLLGADGQPVKKPDTRMDQNIDNIRKEFNSRAEVKKFVEVVPIIRSIQTAKDTAAGDLDFIYGVGKILDPESVVREGEMALVMKSGSPLERFKGEVNRVMGGGRLTPQTRTQLLQMLQSRVGELDKNYQSARSVYEGIATRRGLPASEIFTDYGPIGGGAPVPRVTNDADYAKIPKGAEYIAPDGIKRTKQ